MPVDWMDVSEIPFDAITLLERAQMKWLPRSVPEKSFAVALRAHPTVAWFVRAKCPAIADWLDRIQAPCSDEPAAPNAIREAELAVLRSIDDWLVYVLDPGIYDAQPFLDWDSSELTSMVDFSGKTVLDVGCGTGRLTFVAAGKARTVYAVDPVENLRRYVREKARSRGLVNVFCVDGLITCLPFPDGFADVTMGGHVFGDDPEDEVAEMVRVTRTGGKVVLCPGNNDVDDARHELLVSQGFEWGRFEEPVDGMKRKYWRAR
ncbi:class I SAM-dependent methyltransferase [Candidatus Bipolaricaulota bacterium]|nr:class I SAM-dependent methyltransferase [Candidatus Bipolaricaulota bacterium]